MELRPCVMPRNVLPKTHKVMMALVEKSAVEGRVYTSATKSVISGDSFSGVTARNKSKISCLSIGVYCIIVSSINTNGKKHTMTKKEDCAAYALIRASLTFCVNFFIVFIKTPPIINSLAVLRRIIP